MRIGASTWPVPSAVVDNYRLRLAWAATRINGLYSFDAAGRTPEHPCCGNGIDGPSFPPGDLIAEAVDLAVMSST